MAPGARTAATGAARINWSIAGRLTLGYPGRVPIDLTAHERGAPFTGDYPATLASLQQRLAGLQLAQIVHRRWAIILIEGWEGAGKRAALRQLAAALDPTRIVTHSVSADRDDDERHWLAGFWSRLPAAGQTAIFFGSWYRLLVEGRLSGELDDKAWSRATDELNEFESQQRDHGTLLVKLFFHLTAAEQEQRLRERQDDPWQRWLIGQGAADGLGDRAAQETAWSEAFGHTNTRWAPWRIVDAGDPRSATIATLGAVADSLAAAIPADPPSESDNLVYFDKQKRA